MWRRILAGAAAGAAGTAALNAVTFLDMAVRGRPASRTPEQTVEKVADLTRLKVPGDDDVRGNRLQGLGALGGIVTGVSMGVAYSLVDRAVGRPPTGRAGLLVGVTAMAGANGPMVVLGLTDPRRWTAADWLSDVVPHVAFGLVTAWTYEHGAHGLGRAG